MGFSERYNKQTGTLLSDMHSAFLPFGDWLTSTFSPLVIVYNDGAVCFLIARSEWSITSAR